MLRSRLVCVSTLTATVLALGGCMMAPIGTTDNSGAIQPYNPYPGYHPGRFQRLSHPETTRDADRW